MQQSVSSRLIEYKNRSDLRELSIENLDRAARWFIELFGDLDPEKVTFGHADDYKSWLKKERSASAANSYLGIFKPFWVWLAKRRHIKQNPFDAVGYYMVVERQFKPYNTEEIERILACANQQWKTIVCLALCGMREAEILNLCISDIDYSNNTILITPKNDTPYTWRWDIKDHNMAFVGFDDSIASLLTARQEILPANMPYINLKESRWRHNLQLRDQGKLRARQRNCPWGNFTRDWHALEWRAAGRPNKRQFKPKRFHDLRVTFATERYNSGYSMKELQYLLRHSSIKTTSRYIQNVEQQKLIARSARTFSKFYTTKDL